LLDFVVKKDSTSLAHLDLSNHISLERDFHRFDDIGGDSSRSERDEEKGSVESDEKEMVWTRLTRR